MKLTQLKVNDEIEYYGQKYTVLNIEPPNVSLIRSEGDGQIITVQFTGLVNDPSFKLEKNIVRALVKQPNLLDSTPEVTHRAVLDALTDKQRKEVSRRFEMIRPLLVFERAKNNDFRAMKEFETHYGEYLLPGQSLDITTQAELLERISIKYSTPDEFGVKPKGISPRTLKRYLAAYRKTELELAKRGEEGLITKKGNGYQNRRDNRTIEICHPKKPDMVLGCVNVRIGEEYVPIIKQAIEQDYLSIKRKTKQAVYDSIVVRCAKQGLQPPSVNTIVKMLGRIDPHIRVRLRDGNKAAEAYDPITRGFSNGEAQYPLHIVEIDHTELDLDVLDGRTGHTIGRPWITLGIDVFSRMVWCLYVSFEPPSANVVRKAIEQGIFFKHSKERYGTFNEWDVFGIPHMIYMDNGSEFRNAAVRRMIEETLQSHVRYRPVKTPRYGGTIERLFGTINKQLIHQLDGTRKSSPRDLGEYNADQEAKLTLEDVREIMTMYIVDQYHMKQHRGLLIESDTPIVRYLEGIHKIGFPEFVSPDQETLLRLELLPNEMKPYTRDGVRLNNVRYKLDTLSNLIAPQSTKYKVKYDIDDISHIYLQPPGSPEYVLVPAVQPAAEEIAGMNWYTWREIRRILHQEAEEKRAAIPGTQRVVEAKQILQERIAKKYKAGRRARQQAARMNVPVSIEGVLSPQPSIHKPSLRDRLAAARRAAEARVLEEGDE